MKRFAMLALMLFVLTGCRGEDSLNRAIALRQSILTGQGCAFDAVVTADYGDKLYTFGMRCKSDSTGSLCFEVTEPESISGITGTISSQGGKLTFDDQMLAFELLADGQLTPVSAPWVVIRSMRSGYIQSCGENGDGLYIQIDDSYSKDALHVDLWTDANSIPFRAEILYDGKRILSLDVENFTIL